MIGVKLNGDLIREIRRKVLHMTQPELADLSERVEDAKFVFSERSLRSAEAGNPVSADIFVRLAKILRVDPADQLLAGKEVTLENVRFVGQKVEYPPDGQGAETKKKSAADGIARVTLDLQQRKRLRQYVLEMVTPDSGFKLPKGGRISMRRVKLKAGRALHSRASYLPHCST
jgi:hypothetical protein